MSAAGIPVFYGALDKQTAGLEVESADPNRPVCTIGEFETLRPVRVLDLGHQIQGVSLFDPQKRHQRPVRAFLRQFRKSISRPIEKDDRIHIEYVPTQVVAEYFRHIFTDPKGAHLDGILYPSTKRVDGICCVLFMAATDCVDYPEAGKALRLRGADRIRKKGGKK
jgi:hypothetical protein